MSPLHDPLADNSLEHKRPKQKIEPKTSKTTMMIRQAVFNCWTMVCSGIHRGRAMGNYGTVRGNFVSMWGSLIEMQLQTQRFQIEGGRIDLVLFICTSLKRLSTPELERAYPVHNLLFWGIPKGARHSIFDLHSRLPTNVCTP